MNRKQLSLLVFSALIGTANLSANAAKVGESMPSFILPTLQQNQSVNLKDFQGKVVYLDFWASWCAPCRTSFPLLNKLHQKLKAQGFEVVAVNVDENKADGEKFLKEFGVDFTVLRENKGELSDKLGVESMPTSFILNKQGVIQHVHKGFTSDDVDELEQKITALLAK